MLLRLSLRGKLLLGVALMLAPLLGLLLYDYQAEYARQRADVLDGLTQTAEAVAALADASFDEALALAQVLAEDPVVQSLDPARVDPHLQRITHAYWWVGNLVVVDAAGDERGAAIRLADEPRLNVADRAYFQQVMASGQPVLSEVLVGRILQRPVALAAAPLPGPPGRPRGVAIVSVELESLAARLRSVGLRPGQGIYLLDPTGRLAFHTGLPELAWDQRDLSATPEVRAALAGEKVQSANYRSPLLGEVQAAALVPTPRHGWVVGVTWPAAVAFGPLEAAFRLKLLTFGLIGLASVLGAAALGAFLVRPVVRLAAHARALGRGDLRRRVKIETGDELQVLGEAFNAMAERVQQAMRLREEFLAAAAHELRTPTTSLKGYAQFLQRRPPHDAQEQRALTAIGHAADRAARLARELAELYTLTEGVARLKRAPVDLQALALERAEAAQGWAERHRFLVCAAGPVWVEADRERLALALDALLEHAVRYQPQGGDVRVTVAEERGEAVVEVRDFGVGVPPERLGQVFEPLFEPWPPGSPNYVGVVGLDLYLARRLVEAHGGRIEAESQPGQGSTFRFRLPLAAPERRGRDNGQQPARRSAAPLPSQPSR